jgi:phosphatidylinositol 4-phosphatase
LITHHFRSNPFYFSYTYNLTNSLHQNSLQGSNGSAPFWQRSDDRFFWNRYLQNPLIEFRNQSPSNAEVDGFILPIIFGFLHIQHTFANQKALTVALIYRRSRVRVGTRFFSRGIDVDGNVSNFNETEQMLLVPGTSGQTWMSYIQTRGSVPVYWAEVMDLKYKPKLKVLGQIDKSVALFLPKSADVD